MSIAVKEFSTNAKRIVRRAGIGKPGRPISVTAAAKGSSLAALREALGWSRNQLARVINSSDRALVNWEQNEPISAVYAAKLRELQTIHDELKTLMKPVEIGPWLTTEMDEFDGHSPADLIRRGETGRLWQSLFYLRTGQPD